MEKKSVTIILAFALLLSSGLIATSADNEMTVEANFIGYGEEVISIEVPNYLFLGEVEKGDYLSDEEKVYINNTGNVNVIVTPELVSNSSDVFNYLFFREQKTHNGTAVLPEQIGEYNISIEKMDDGYFYMMLNLTDFNGTLLSDNLNLSTTIKFTAMADE